MTTPIASNVAGTVTHISATEGAAVTVGTNLLYVDAMKMEIPCESPVDGFVSTIHVQAGEQVLEGQLLVEVTTGAPPT